MKSIAVVILLIIQSGNISLNTYYCFFNEKAVVCCFVHRKIFPYPLYVSRDSQEWSHAELHSPTLFRYLGGQLLLWHLSSQLEFPATLLIICAPELPKLYWMKTILIRKGFCQEDFFCILLPTRNCSEEVSYG